MENSSHEEMESDNSIEDHEIPDEAPSHLSQRNETSPKNSKFDDIRIFNIVKEENSEEEIKESGNNKEEAHDQKPTNKEKRI